MLKRDISRSGITTASVLRWLSSYLTCGLLLCSMMNASGPQCANMTTASWGKTLKPIAFRRLNCGTLTASSLMLASQGWPLWKGKIQTRRKNLQFCVCYHWLHCGCCFEYSASKTHSCTDLDGLNTEKFHSLPISAHPLSFIIFRSYLECSLYYYNDSKKKLN